LQECNSNPHFGHRSGFSPNAGKSVPHCAQRETSRVPGICNGRGPKVSFLTGFSKDFFSAGAPLS
jgi:hypothetical protein